MINVTKTYLPPMEKYVEYLRTIWENAWVTNHGPLAGELEQKLKEHLKVKHLFFVSNGTIALQIALKALEVRGEVITTPFSYVATTSTIVWEGCSPVFVDIDRETLDIDADAIEGAITPETTAIMATHVYGNPCDIDKINDIARRHRLKVIYDAAHAFGVGYKGQSVLNYGDISALSFHATKLFHTAEGGALVTNDDSLAHRISYMRNFGHQGQEAFWGLGINGKNTELHAAMGLCVLPEVPNLIRKRKEVSALYDDLLREHGILRPRLQGDTLYNYAYYPAIFPSEEKLLKVRDALLANGIAPRRYFFPSLSTLRYVRRHDMPIAEDISKRVLCLPLYHDLPESSVRLIAKTIVEHL